MNKKNLIEAEWCIYAWMNYGKIGSDIGLRPGRRQAIFWTSAGLLSIGTLGKLQWLSNRNSNIFIQENACENIAC